MQQRWAQQHRGVRAAGQNEAAMPEEPRILGAEGLGAEGLGAEDPRVIVRSATEFDLDAVLELAQAVQLYPGMDTRKGFLVSALGRETYAAALSYLERQKDEHVVFLIAESNRKVAGFLFGYNDVYASRRSGGRSEADIAVRFQDSYYVLKQIATDLNDRQRGVARRLAERFFSEVKCSVIFSAIVAEPENPASCAFHREMGFSPLFESISRSASGETYRNQVWRRACPQASENGATGRST
jgi:predicted GNAT superfamily acetyltransferase